jgi:hypothetical protein
MAIYSVHFLCNECSDVHPTGITLLAVNDGPQVKASIGDTYAGKDLPASVAALMDNRFMCPNTQRFTSQKDNDQVFLLKIG